MQGNLTAGAFRPEGGEPDSLQDEHLAWTVIQVPLAVSWTPLPYSWRGPLSVGVSVRRLFQAQTLYNYFHNCL